MSVAGAFVLFMGIGVIGALTSGGMRQAAATGPMSTVTVTASVPGPTQTATVQVPGPTQTVQVPGPTKTVAAASCQRALSLAETVMDDDNSGWNIVSTALSAGDITAAGNGLRSIAAKKQADRVTYLAMAADCRNY